MAQIYTLSDLRQRAQEELTTDILPFWTERAFDPSTGRLTGLYAHDLRYFDNEPRHSVLCARILWTFAAAARITPNPAWIEVGKKALTQLTGPFWDKNNRGVFWSLNAAGEVHSSRKQIYAQAFAIYGLSEWFLVTRDETALDYAKQLYAEIEKHAADPRFGGYLEARDYDWSALADMRLSPRDLNSPKSMNTLLHIMEAYTNLLRAWPDPTLRENLHKLLVVMLDKVVTETPFTRCALFFDTEWRSLTNTISYGHDIEASWLLWEAAELLNDPALKERTRKVCIDMAAAVLANAIDKDGAIYYCGDSSGVTNSDKHWWPQAEAVVGFLNAYSISGRNEFLDASMASWKFIEDFVIDRKQGEWFSILDKSGRRYPDFPECGDSFKIGPWKCPYHNARACIELIHRL